MRGISANVCVSMLSIRTIDSCKDSTPRRSRACHSVGSHKLDQAHEYCDDRPRQHKGGQRAQPRYRAHLGAVALTATKKMTYRVVSIWMQQTECKEHSGNGSVRPACDFWLQYEEIDERMGCRSGSHGDELSSFTGQARNLWRSDEMRNLECKGSVENASYQVSFDLRTPN
jgi:hypothetical protein